MQHSHWWILPFPSIHDTKCSHACSVGCRSKRQTCSCLLKRWTNQSVNTPLHFLDEIKAAFPRTSFVRCELWMRELIAGNLQQWDESVSSRPDWSELVWTADYFPFFLSSQAHAVLQNKLSHRDQTILGVAICVRARVCVNDCIQWDDHSSPDWLTLI